MSLNFASASTDRVTHGTALGPYTSCSFCTWVYPTALAAFNAILYHESAINPGADTPSLTLGQVSSDEIRAKWQRATLSTVYETNNANLTANKWWFVALTFDQAGGAGEIINIYLGDLATVATERTYGTAQDGSGTFDTNTGTGLFIGNNMSPFDIPWNGRIANAKFWTGVVLTAAQVQREQFRIGPQLSGAAFASVYGYNGTGTQPDWSGSAHPGTVTGATVADHVPIPFRRVGLMSVPYAVVSQQRRFLLTRF